MSTIELLSCLGLNGMDKPWKAVLAFAEVGQMSAYCGSVRGALRRPGFTTCTADEHEQINRTLSSGCPSTGGVGIRYLNCQLD